MKLALLGLMAVAVTIPLAAPAHARIVCIGEYQVVNGSQISTPFCRDNYLARVAREYGVKVSEAAIRDNPNLKKEVCRFVGRDIRVYNNCVDENHGRGSR